MAESGTAISTTSTTKMSFGFSKKVESKLKPPPRAASDSNLVGNLFEHDHSSADSSSKKKADEEDTLIIPLIKRNRWVAKPSSSTLSKNVHGSQSLSAIDESESSTTKHEQPPEPTVKKETTTYEDEDAKAAAEIIKDVQKLHIVNEDDDEPMEIPVWMDNRPPPGFETDEHFDVGLRADESTLDDYERIPIEKFGMAMLRGMGFKEDEGIGKTHKKLIKPVEVKIRPRGLGLGATPINKKKEKGKSDGKEEENTVEITVGLPVMISQGRYENRIGRVSGSDNESGRWLVTLVGEEKRVVSIAGVSLSPITEKEYEKAGKYINNDKYHDYKVVQEERLSKIQAEVRDAEKASSGSSRERSSDTGDRRDRRDKDRRDRRDRSRSPRAEARYRDDRSDKKKRRRSRSRSRSPRR